MKCQKSKLFCISLVAFLFLSVASYSEVCYSDQDHQELTIIFDGLETTINEQATKISEQAISIEASDLIINEQAISLKGVERSLVEEREAQLAKLIGWTAGGIAAGLIAGFIAGIMVR